MSLIPGQTVSQTSELRKINSPEGAIIYTMGILETGLGGSTFLASTQGSGLWVRRIETCGICKGAAGQLDLRMLGQVRCKNQMR